MQQIRIIDNLYLKNGGLCAEDAIGATTSVFIKQGSIDGACMIYCMIMLLIMERKITKHEIMDKFDKNDSSFVGRFKKRFLDGFRFGKGFTNYNFYAQLNKVAAGDFSINSFVNHKGENLPYVSYKQFYEILEDIIYKGKPVQISYWNSQRRSGHSVVVVGISKTPFSMRLYCLDPSFNLPYGAYWNNIIDIDTDKTRENWHMHYDYSWMAENEVVVDALLYIDTPLEKQEEDLTI